MSPRLRVTLAPAQLRAVANAIERGTPIEVAARVLDVEAPARTGLEPGGTVLLEVRTDAPDGENAVEPLTPREREVLELVAEGMSNRAIAERLAISEHTVKFHVGALLGKLSAATRAELVAIALRSGLIML
ncbi:MAG TPA: LuxR C-terminal-related transcriptional regulator [Burkholderiales bacterium]|nr:LuxR C-terminal-related transcriptional regulator [Burkholderiales bacterium]